ncbi:MAG TPA: hypothetical protein VNT03_15585 [Baekduia sp.]|nr:hypothetical protein [Baekduia sp.]
MSKYGLDKALWTCIRNRDAMRELTEGPEQFIQRFDLSESERRALVEGDVRGLYASAAIPFLIYQFALVRNRGFTIEFAQHYVGALQGLPPQEIST